ncbi:MAG: hypothetical protein M0C28_00585 [Candidatus Moduliflexus flocculans]|nr:hypothetical protein [Candidatus Moduliflexus flocculans]
MLSPKSRYLQVKVLLRTQTGKTSPVFDRLAVFYLQSNVAPGRCAARVPAGRTRST